MSMQTKVIGRQPTDHGPYDPQLAYGKKFTVTLFDCGWESKHDNNTTAPATLNAQAGTITPNIEHWIHRWGSYNQWLIDNGYKKVPASNIEDLALEKPQNEINAALVGEIGADSAPRTVKGRIKSLENSVGTGGSVDQRIAQAKSEVIGGASSSGNTLKKVEDRVSPLEEAVGSGGSIDSRISSAVEAEKSRAETAELSLSSGKADKATTLAGYGITDAYIKSETYTKAEVNGLVDTPHQEYVTVDAYASLPATGSKDTIYRVSNYNGSTSQVDESVYSEYAWDGTQYIFLCVKSQISEVFDISVYNNNAKYADLSAALNGGDNIPQSLQKGGMSVKFVQSSDNKYVQYRLMSDSWSININDWSFCGDNVLVENPEWIYVLLDAKNRILAGLKSDGNVEWSIGVPTPVANFVKVIVAEYTSKFDNIPLQIQEVPQDIVEMSTDSEGRIVRYRDKEGTLYEYSVEIENVNVGNVHYKNGIPQQIKDYVDSYQPTQEEMPYNDLISIGSRVLKIYNPYKEVKGHQYTGQMHCHSWTKFAENPGIEFPYGYTQAQTLAMTPSDRISALENVAADFVQRHKDEGYDFIALSNYSQFGDVTHKPAVMPENFLWLCDSYETTSTTLGRKQHMIVHCAPDFSVPYDTGTFNDVMDRVQDYGCVVHWPHPTDHSTYASPEVVGTVKSRLRLMEVYDGISYRKWNSEAANDYAEQYKTYGEPGVMPDGPFDTLLTQGNFAFCMAISDERPTIGRGSNTQMTTSNYSRNIKNGCVKVFADNLTSEEIFDSLLSGNFYASSCSDISINSVTIADGRYTIDVGIEGVIVEFLKENNTIVKTITTSAGNTTVYYDITGNEQFVRARIYKLNSKEYDADYWFVDKEWVIWTQPVFISKTIL